MTKNSKIAILPYTVKKLHKKSTAGLWCPSFQTLQYGMGGAHRCGNPGVEGVGGLRKIPKMQNPCPPPPPTTCIYEGPITNPYEQYKLRMEITELPVSKKVSDLSYLVIAFQFVDKTQVVLPSGVVYFLFKAGLTFESVDENQNDVGLWMKL